MKKSYWLNKKVISISNNFETDPEDSSLYTGTIVDFVEITQSKTLCPVVLFDGGDGEPKLTFSALMEYDSELYNILTKLTAKERWTVLQAFVCRLNPLHLI